MGASESLEMLRKAQSLAATGQHAAVVALLGARPAEETERSPSLALLLGIANARLGENAKAEGWIDVALRGARARGDRATEMRALNVSGALALERGRVDDAARFVALALAEAERVGDHATVGRCSNNLGIIANMRGDFGRAIGSYTSALAAFQRAGLKVGIAEALHNLAITYREQGDFGKGLETADRAVEEAQASGDRRLTALARGGRAELRLAAGEAAVARREIEQVMELRRTIGDVVGEAEDRRVWAGTLAASGNGTQAEATLREVAAIAEERGRPLLAANAQRDLARLLTDQGRVGEAIDLVDQAISVYERLGAEAEAHKLKTLAAGLRPSSPA